MIMVVLAWFALMCVPIGAWLWIEDIPSRSRKSEKKRKELEENLERMRIMDYAETHPEIYRKTVHHTDQHLEISYQLKENVPHFMKSGFE